MGQGRAFPCRSHRDKTVGSFRDLPIDQGAKGGLIDRIMLKWRDKRSKRPSEARSGSHSLDPRTWPIVPSCRNKSMELEFLPDENEERLRPPPFRRGRQP